MLKQRLLAPGPTTIPEKVLSSMAEPIIHHRTPQFRQILAEVQEGLKYIFQTQNDVLLLASSGTGAMEASISNLLSPGDKALVIRGGKFGERFAEIATAYKIETEIIDVEWGEAVDPAQVEAKLSADKDKSIKAVYATLCETSTGVAHDIQALGRIVSQYPAVLVVDAISGLGAMELKPDDWGVDVVVAGSQKGLMIPPGLAMISLSCKAWELVEKSRSPRYYFDLRAYRKSLTKTDTPYTPAASLIIGLSNALRMIKEEGLENILKRHRRLAEATRAAVKAMGLNLFSAQPAEALTAVEVPEGIDGQAVVKILRDKYGLTIAGGQGKLKGKIFRIAHLGYVDILDCLQGISALELVLYELGYKFNLGAGVSAAEQVFLKDI